MKKNLFIFLILLYSFELLSQEASSEFGKIDNTNYKIGIGGILSSAHYGMDINGRYKFKNKRELGLIIGGLWIKSNGKNFDHHALISYLPLKKRERKFGLDLVVSSGVYRQYRNYFYGKSEYITIPALVGFDIYYNFYKDFILSANGNTGVGLGNFSTTGNYYHEKGSTTFIFIGFIELKYKIKWKSNK